MRSLFLFAFHTVVGIGLYGCAHLPPENKAARLGNTIYVPAEISLHIARTSQSASARDQYAVVFKDPSGNEVDRAYLGAQLPPYSCQAERSYPITLELFGLDATKNEWRRLSMEKTSSTPDHYEIKIYQPWDGPVVVTADLYVPLHKHCNP